MWSGVGYNDVNVFKKVMENFDDSEESDLSQVSSEVSQTSQNTYTLKLGSAFKMKLRNATRPSSTL